jgi:hypothetical protein
MSEEQTSYKVTDRRLFNPDGSPREVPDSEKPEPQPEAKPTPLETATAATSSSDLSVAAEPAAAPPAAETLPQGEDQPSVAEKTTESAADVDVDVDGGAEVELPGADDPASFASFMMSIASNAASSLGMMEHPVTGKREVDLELGKHWIDVLGMLEQKTRGNLLPQEQQILEGLLADLRMQYVSLTSAAPKPRAYTSRDITGG